MFTCDGIITRYTIGGARNNDGTQAPKIQIWRESPDQCGEYFKTDPDIAADNSVCNGGAKILSTGLFQCTLKEKFRVRVQAGDILGLELPTVNDRDFVIRFTSGELTNYEFQNQQTGSVSLSDRINEVQEQPQINFTIIEVPGRNYSPFNIAIAIATLSLTYMYMHDVQILQLLQHLRMM